MHVLIVMWLKTLMLDDYHWNHSVDYKYDTSGKDIYIYSEIKTWIKRARKKQNKKTNKPD